METLVKETAKFLSASVDKEAMFAYFQFLEEAKTFCKQYLMYFSQFVEDLGISVDTEMLEEANQTLFKVTPRNKKEALSKIREALDIYLNAPNSKDFQIQIAPYSDVGIKQWESNIYHLKSQLLLANSINLSNQVTIEALSLSNLHYKQLREVNSNKEQPVKEEDVIKGIVTLGQFKWNGVTIDLGQILKKIKRRFNKK